MLLEAGTIFSSTCGSTALSVFIYDTLYAGIKQQLQMNKSYGKLY